MIGLISTSALWLVVFGLCLHYELQPTYTATALIISVVYSGFYSSNRALLEEIEKRERPNDSE